MKIVKLENLCDKKDVLVTAGKWQTGTKTLKGLLEGSKYEAKREKIDKMFTTRIIWTSVF